MIAHSIERTATFRGVPNKMKMGLLVFPGCPLFVGLTRKPTVPAAETPTLGGERSANPNTPCHMAGQKWGNPKMACLGFLATWLPNPAVQFLVAYF